MDLRAGLQRGFGNSYRIERELGGGGMSRVFLAAEAALDRNVVIKVLAPELMLGASADRFKREIALSAQLQHPHIVAVLNAGETTDPAGGWRVPYYTMPFVDGESLRARLLRAGPLPFPGAISILRDVARALVYAHEHGVVHRDIKPDNVLITGDCAVVTDFGVAKAIVAARGDKNTTLTDAGGVIGTPAYMSPEQATGNGGVDHRADIYAFGVMAYEMLAGRQPFTGDSAELLAKARLTKPTDVAELRPGTPPLLAELVMRCIEPNPDRRPPSAAHVVHVLDNVTSGAGNHRSVDSLLGARRRRTAAIGVLTALAATGAFVALRVLGVWPGASLFATGALTRHERILVGDFRSSDTTLASVVTEAFRISLAQSSNIGVLSSIGMREALRRMARDGNTPVEGSVAREMAMREGLKAFVDGEILSVGGRYVISARLTEASSGEPLVTLQEQADNERGILPAVDRLTRDLRERAGDPLAQIRAALPLAQVTTPSLEALRDYVQGTMVANYDGDFDRGRRLLEQAISIDTAFAMAYRKLAVELFNREKEPELRISYIRKAYQHRDRLTDAERYLVVGSYFEMGPEADVEKSFEAAQAAAEAEPTNSTALNNAAVELQRAHRFEDAQRYLERAIQTPDASSQSFGMYAYNALFLHDTALARRALYRMERRFGRRAPLIRRRAEVFYALGDLDSAVAAARRLADMEAAGGYMRSRGMRLVAGMVGTHGRVRETSDALARAAVLHALVDSQPLVPALDSVWVTIALRDDTARGRRMIARSLAAQPIASIPHPVRPYANLGRLLADAGRIDELKALAALFERDSRTMRTQYDSLIRAELAGDIALVEHRYADAADNFHQAAMASSDCFVCAWPLEAHAFDLAGMPDSAIAVFTRYVEQADPWRAGGATSNREEMVDATWLARTYVRLGELWEQKGDRAKAAKYYSAFLALWKDADPELQPRVAAVRRRLTLLGGG